VKFWIRAATTLGIAAVVWLIVREGADSIVGLLKQAGWPMLLLVPFHFVPLLLDVMGWRALIEIRTRIRRLFLIAAIREAINRLLPVANVGGELIGIRLLMREGVSGTAATSSVIIEMLLNVAAQLLFLELGLAILLRITGSVRASGAMFIAAAGPLPLVLALIWLLRSGKIFRLADKLGEKLLDPNVKGAGRWKNLTHLDAAIRRLTSAHARLLVATGWQFLGLVAGSLETWLALFWLGHRVSIGGAVVLESFTLAARSLFFFAPGGLGVQEAGLIGIGHMLGLGGDVAIALSLAKRMREILFGLPAIALWRLRSTVR
jgi:putative membrane protein